MGTASRIVVAQDATVWLAPVGTAAPTDVATAPTGNWREVGFFTPDSLKWQTNPSFEEVRSHQSNYATRRFQTADEATVEVDLQEWSANNILAVYGGGTLSTPSAGVYKYVPPAIGARIDVAVIIEIVDGTKKYRRIIPRATQTEGVEQTFQRASESVLPLRLSVLGSDSVTEPWYDLTNDPSFNPTGVTITLPGFTNVSPTSVGTAAGTTVTVTGFNLGAVTGATFGGVAATSVVATANQVTMVTPVQTAGSKALVLTYPGGTLACGNITVA